MNDSRIITSISKVMDCKDDYEDYMGLARLDSLRFVVSNTTEAGIVLDKNDSMEGLPATYPGKLTKFLYERYMTFNGDVNKGLIILPVELIENNGGKLKECVLALCDCWDLPEEFKSWVTNACVFCSTLVDRIVTGYPRNEVAAICEELGYQDNLVDVGEPFGCPVPTVKVSSNTPLYEKKKNWIDFNAGALLDGTSMDALADEFYEYILKLASEEVHAKSEMLDKHELAIFKDGVTL